MSTLASDLRAILTNLDARASNDDAYRNVFSTFCKQRLAPGTTWRQRLVRWREQEEALVAEETLLNAQADISA